MRWLIEFLPTIVIPVFFYCCQAQREKEVRQQQERQEEEMAAEMERLRMAQNRDSKMRQQIRETRCFIDVALYACCRITAIFYQHMWNFMTRNRTELRRKLNFYVHGSLRIVCWLPC